MGADIQDLDIIEPTYIWKIPVKFGVRWWNLFMIIWIEMIVITLSTFWNFEVINALTDPNLWDVSQADVGRVSA